MEYKIKFNIKEGVWRTIGGRRVFIKTGQTLSDAMHQSGKFKIKKEAEPPKERDYTNAKLTEDEDGTKVILEDGSSISQLSKKEYKKLTEDFANKLDDEEVELVNDYVTSPGISGDLNAGEKGNKYFYNYSDTDYYISQNELNRRYMELYEQYKKDNMPTFDRYEYKDNKKAYDWVRKNVSDKLTDDRAKEILWQIREREDAVKEGWDTYNSHLKYYTKKEIDDAKVKYEQLKKIEKEKYDEYYNNGWSKRYEQLGKEHEKITGGNFSAYYYEKISNIDNNKVFNTLDYDYDKAVYTDLRPTSFSKILAMQEYTGSQSSDFMKVFDNTHKFVNDFNNLFDKKGVVLDKDILLFRRGRDDDIEIGGSFQLTGITSTSAFDTLPKKMPSGAKFGEQSYYVVVPKGTPMVFAEKVIGKKDILGRYEDTNRGVRRQHEVMLRPGTEYQIVSNGGWNNSGKYIENKIIVAKSPNNIIEEAYKKYLAEHPNSDMSLETFKKNYK